MVAQTQHKTDGFSQRFCELLDKADFPEKGRLAHGAEAIKVSVSTFHQYTTADQPPRNYNTLVEYVQIILKNIPGEYDPNAVACWLYGGPAVPNPFDESDLSFILKADIYFMVNTAAAERGLKLDPAAAADITYRLYHYVSDQTKKNKIKGSVRSNADVMSLINSALQLEEAGIR